MIWIRLLFWFCDVSEFSLLWLCVTLEMKEVSHSELVYWFSLMLVLVLKVQINCCGL